MPTRWEVEGADRLYLNLQALAQYVSADAKEITKAEIVEVGQDIVDYAKSIAPRDTGRLIAEIEMTVTDEGVEIKSGAPYSIYVEFGTVKMPERPFLRPAYHRYGVLTRLQQRHEAEMERLFR